MAEEFQEGAFGFAALMLAGQTLEALKRKGVLTDQDVIGVLNACMAEFRAAGTPSAVQAANLLIRFYNATPDVNLLVPKPEEGAAPH